MGNNRLVYSTESGRICPSRGHPIATCTCKKKKTVKNQSIYPNDGIERIRREVEGRKGKTVTAVFGIRLDDKKLQQFAKTLKRLCGTGDTA
jgi:translation initiation factor 1